MKKLVTLTAAILIGLSMQTIALADDSNGESGTARTVWTVNAEWPYDVTIGDGHYYGVDGTKLVLLDGGQEQTLANISDLDLGGIDPNTFRSGHIVYDNGDIYWGGLLWKPTDDQGAGVGYNIIMRYHNGQLSKLLFEPAFYDHDLNDPNQYVYADKDNPDPRLVNYYGKIIYNYVMNNTVPNVTVDGDYLDVVMMGTDPEAAPSTYGSWEKIVRINKYTGEQTILDYDQGLGLMSHVDGTYDPWYENGMNILVMPKGDTWEISDGNFRIYTLNVNTPDPQPNPYMDQWNVKFTPRQLKLTYRAFPKDFYHPKIYGGYFWYANSYGICRLDEYGVDEIWYPSQFPQIQWIKDWAMDNKSAIFADPVNHTFTLTTLPKSHN